MPELEDFARFPGRVLHSHDYRGADEFVGKNLLVVGGSYSAEDITMQCYKYGARSITISYRSVPFGFKWPENVKEVPLVQRIEGHTAYFIDGTTVSDIDCIILCTGYRHNHSYMAKKLRLRCTSNLFVPFNLYKGIFWAAQPRLAYLGMQNQAYTLNMFDLQAALVRDVLLEHVQLPDDTSEQNRRDDIAQWQAREQRVTPGHPEGFIDLQTEYLRDIINCCDQTTVPKFDLDRSTAIMYKIGRDKLENIVTFRDQTFPSIFPPYKVAPVCQTPWLKNMDDSLEGFLASIRTV